MNDKPSVLPVISKALLEAGYSVPEVELISKALPSQPVWYQLQPDLGFWDANRAELLTLMACYQKNPIIHGAIDINAKGITSAQPCLMRVVNKGAKKLVERKLKRLSAKRLKKLLKHWSEPNLCRKSLGDDQELVEVTEHPLLDALHSDEQDQNFHSLLRLIVVNLCIYGIAFVQKYRDGMGRITSYRYLPAWNVTPDRGEDGRVTGWYYSSSYGDSFDTKVPIDRDDMVVIRWPSISDPHAGGDSPLKSALRKIELSGKWLDWQNWLLNNRARPDYIYVPKGESITKDVADRNMRVVNNKFRGQGNGLPAITDAGSIIPLNWAPTDLAPLKFDEELRSSILFALSIPEAFATNDSNKATMAASLEQWARQSLAPIVYLLESALNKMAREYDPSLIWVFENVIPEDRAQELAEETFEVEKWNQALISQAVTKDEYREIVLGLEALPEEPDAPEQPQIDLEEQDEAEDQEDSEEQAEQIAEDQSKAFDLLALNKQVAKGSLDRATAINLVAFSLKLSQEDAKALVTHIKQKKQKGKAKALPQLHIMNPKPFMDVIGMCFNKQLSHYLKQLTGNHPTKALGDELPDGFTRDVDWDSDDARLYKPYVHMQAQEAADGRIQSFVDIGAKQGAFSAVPDNVSEAVNKSTLQFAQSTNETTEKTLNDALAQLRDELKTGVTEGDPIPLMRKKVEAIFEGMDSAKAEQIARTELSRAQHEAQRITAKASGIVKGFKLLASSECCDECAELDGTEVGMDDQFQDSDYDDSILPIHPNCRCTMLEVIDTDSLKDDDNE
jgi:SPP1 gp7 family putative phage head morphogenesis protein